MFRVFSECVWADSRVQVTLKAFEIFLCVSMMSISHFSRFLYALFVISTLLDTRLTWFFRLYLGTTIDFSCVMSCCIRHFNTISRLFITMRCLNVYEYIQSHSYILVQWCAFLSMVCIGTLLLFLANNCTYFDDSHIKYKITWLDS